MEPTLFQAIVAGILTAIIIILLSIVCTYFLAEWWRTKRGSTRYEYAYHSRQNNYECKFVTEGRNKW